MEHLGLLLPRYQPWGKDNTQKAEKKKKERNWYLMA
jgi:hypothetical protein